LSCCLVVLLSCCLVVLLSCCLVVLLSCCLVVLLSCCLVVLFSCFLVFLLCLVFGDAILGLVSVFFFVCFCLDLLVTLRVELLLECFRFILSLNEKKKKKL